MKDTSSALSVLRKPGLLKKTGLSYSTIWRKMQADEFPKPISLGDNAIGWLEHEIDEWITSRGRIVEAEKIEYLKRRNRDSKLQKPQLQTTEAAAVKT